MIPMVMGLIQGGLALAGAGISAAGTMSQTAALRRQARLRVGQLQTNAEITGMRSAFEQGRIEDQVDAVQARQENHFAAGNIDPTSGSAAILQAQTEALGMQDQMLIAAKGQQERADIFGQIAATWGRADDASRAGALNIASTVLSAAGKLAGISGDVAAKTGGWGAAGGNATSFAPAASQPMNLKPWGLS